MDVALRAFLDSHDDHYWDVLVKKLARTAYGFMASHNFGGGNLWGRAQDYAQDTITKAYDACIDDLPSKFDQSRGNQSLSIDERFWNYLKHILLLPIIKHDVEKWQTRSTLRTFVQTGEIDEAKHFDPGKLDSSYELLLHSLLEGADEELQKLIYAVHKQLEENPDWNSVNWTKIQEDLGLTRHHKDQLRARLREQLARITEPQAV